MYFFHAVRGFFRDLGEILKGLGKKANEDSAEKLLTQNFDFSNAVQMGGFVLLIAAIAGLWILFERASKNKPGESSQPSPAADLTTVQLRFFWGLAATALIGAGAIITPPIARIVFPKTISVTIAHAGLDRPTIRRMRCNARTKAAVINGDSGLRLMIAFCEVSPDCSTVTAIIEPVRDYAECRASHSHIPRFSERRNWTDACNFEPDITANEAWAGETSRLDNPAYPWLACALPRTRLRVNFRG